MDETLSVQVKMGESKPGGLHPSSCQLDHDIHESDVDLAAADIKGAIINKVSFWLCLNWYP